MAVVVFCGNIITSPTAALMNFISIFIRSQQSNVAIWINVCTHICKQFDLCCVARHRSLVPSQNIFFFNLLLLLSFPFLSYVARRRRSPVQAATQRHNRFEFNAYAHASLCNCCLPMKIHSGVKNNTCRF